MLSNFKLNSTRLVRGILITAFIFLYSPIAARSALVDEEMPRLRDTETIIANALIALWALSIPYFLFNVVYIGFLYMTSMGDETKAQTAKQRGGRIILSFAIVFGGWIIVKFLIEILQLKGAGNCMDTVLPDPMIKFFFENPC